ncbi:MAG: TlpA disulfide reductase family protein [Bacteroidota bacterium]
MKQILLLFSFAVCAFACQNTATTDTETPAETEEPAEAMQTAAPKAEMPELKVTYLETAVGKVPVYNTFEGVEPYFKKNNDTTYVVNFWATWCKPCVEELPYFEKIQSAYAGQKVQVVLVSMDFERQLEKKLKPFLEEYKLKSAVAVLTDNKYNNWIDKVDPSWGGAIPVTMIYNSQDRKFFGDQFSDFEELEGALKMFL